MCPVAFLLDNPEREDTPTDERISARATQTSSCSITFDLFLSFFRSYTRVKPRPIIVQTNNMQFTPNSDLFIPGLVSVVTLGMESDDTFSVSLSEGSGGVILSVVTLSVVSSVL